MSIESDIIKQQIKNGKFRCKKCLSTFKINNIVNNLSNRIYFVSCTNSLCNQQHKIIRSIDNSINIEIIKDEEQ